MPPWPQRRSSLASALASDQTQRANPLAFGPGGFLLEGHHGPRRIPRLRHDPARRGPARGHLVLGRGQAGHRPAARRARAWASSRAAGRGPCPRTPSSSHVPRPGAQAAQRHSWSRSAPPARPGSVPPTTPRSGALLDSQAPVITPGGQVRRPPREGGAAHHERGEPRDGRRHGRLPASRNGRRVFVDCEHFFDGYKHDPRLRRDAAADGLRRRRRASAVMCDTNGGMLPVGIHRMVTDVRRALAACGWASTARTTPAARWPTPSRPSRPASPTCSARPTGTASAPATPTSSSVVANLELKLGIRALPEGNLREAKRISHALADIANLPPDTHQAVRRGLVVRAQGRPARLRAEGQRVPVQPHRPAAGRQRHADPGHGDGRSGDRGAQGPRARLGHRLGPRGPGPGRRDGQVPRGPGLDLRGRRRLLRAAHARRAARRASPLLRRRVLAHDRLPRRSTATATAPRPSSRCTPAVGGSSRWGRATAPSTPWTTPCAAPWPRSTPRSTDSSSSTTRCASSRGARAPTPSRAC